jgi:hypothetical protein
LKRIKVKSKRGTPMEILSYDSTAKLFYCFIPHLDMTLSIHPSALDIDAKRLDTLKQEMTNEKETN